MSRIKTSLTKRHRGISLVPALFVFILMILFSPSVRAKSFSSVEKVIVPDTNKYDINDPRNPDCPCHKAQKLANDEYRNSQVQKDNNPVDHNPVNNNDVSNTNDNSNSNNSNTNSDVNTNKTTYTSSGGGSQKHYSKFYKFQKKMKRWTKKMNRKLKNKNKGTKGGKINIADCFHLW